MQNTDNPSTLFATVEVEVEKVMNPDIDQEKLEEVLFSMLRAVYFGLLVSIEEAQNLALAEIDGLVQLVRIDEKELAGVAPGYFLS